MTPHMLTDAHCHVTSGDDAVRELLIGRDFDGIHPWDTLNQSADQIATHLAALESRLAQTPRLGVGEIGLDRLRERTISPLMRETFARQLNLAARFHRPAVLHGAKCWGEVVKGVREILGENTHDVPAFLFHGFSRSDGLIPDIVKSNGYISVGPALLNDHAVNYRQLAMKIPYDRLLIETDRTATNAATCPTIQAIARKLAELRQIALDDLLAQLETNISGLMTFA